VIEQFNVTVHDGVVELWGIVGSEQQKEAIKVAAEITPGVRAVTNNLSVGTIVSGL
jgi:osmotically-inducible protein OsmY